LYRKDHLNHKGPFWWFETEDGRKFKLVDFNAIDFCGIEVYLLKKLNVVRAEKWAYEVYPVRRIDLINPQYGYHWKWFKNGYVVYEVKK
jgi:hypothetical protein